MARKGADVRVIGVGGGGGNAVRRMADRTGAGVLLAAANTDSQALIDHPADVRLVLGRRTARGRGAGGNPASGENAARESAPAIAHALHGADLVFVAAGMGGGTGTGAAPIVASLARQSGALTVGVVTLPFTFEGARRRRAAEAGLDALRAEVDSLIVIENDRLLSLASSDPTALEAFARADDVLCEAVRGIADLVLRPGLVNLDFADVRAVLRGGGRAVMSSGVGRGSERAMLAVESAMHSPLLAHGSIAGARGALLCFTVDSRASLGTIHRAAARVQAEVDDEADIFFGVAVDPTLHDEVRVTLVAAGMSEVAVVQEPARRRNALVMLG